MLCIYLYYFVLKSQTDQKSVVAAYDRRGEYIFTGNERGRVMVFKDSDMSLAASFRLSQSLSAAVKSIEFARRGRYFKSIYYMVIIVLRLSSNITPTSHITPCYEKLASGQISTSADVATTSDFC